VASEPTRLEARAILEHDLDRVARSVRARRAAHVPDLDDVVALPNDPLPDKKAQDELEIVPGCAHCDRDRLTRASFARARRETELERLFGRDGIEAPGCDRADDLDHGHARNRRVESFVHLASIPQQAPSREDELLGGYFMTVPPPKSVQ
jgi:hypothetical protein